MVGQLIWWTSITLEIVLLARGFYNRLMYRYPIFYSYITLVLLQDIARLSAYHWKFSLYKPVYWGTEFTGLVFGSLIVFEIYKVSLAAFPGAARMTRNALSTVFVIALVKGLLDASAGWQLVSAAPEIERALRAVQAAAILALVALFLLYSIPFGRNLRGILLGYGLFVGERVICLTFVSLQTHNFWFYAYSASYIGALSLWIGYLWSYQPNPQPRAGGTNLDDEYQKIATATQRWLQGMRGYLRREVRS
jgi:hypothetical protein